MCWVTALTYKYRKASEESLCVSQKEIYLTGLEYSNSVSCEHLDKARSLDSYNLCGPWKFPVDPVPWICGNEVDLVKSIADILTVH